MPNVPSKLLNNVRQLRHEQTDTENYLWQIVRDRQLLGFKFRRQHAIPPYIVDFYCHEAGLVIELDGSQHADSVGKDEVRKKFLESRGLQVLRFWNNEVWENTEAVVEVILQALESN